MSVIPFRQIPPDITSGGVGYMAVAVVITAGTLSVDLFGYGSPKQACPNPYAPNIRSMSTAVLIPGTVP